MIALWFTVAWAWESASTVATVGAVTVAGRDGHAMHTHGGPAARVGDAQFRVTVAGEAPVTLTVTRIEALTGHSCDAPPAEVTSYPTFGGLFPEDGSATESATSLVVRPGTLDVTVGFTAVEAYYSWCDRFAFRVTFDVGGAPLVAVAETNVTRVEPYDR
jgi:hypothetical protein